MRIVLTLVALRMLQWPYLKLVGALLLLGMGVSLLLDNGDGGHRAAPAGAASLLAAVRTILVADLVMSLDNVLAVAAAAKGNVAAAGGRAGAQRPAHRVRQRRCSSKLMQRWPVVVTAGAALLGWLAGEMLLTDPALVARFGAPSPAAVELASAVGAGLVVAVGSGLQRRRQAAARRRE